MAFAFVKATEGVGYVNPSFASDWAAIKAAGMKRGAYHFARPDIGNTPEDEAAWFLAHIPDLQPGDILILDLEVGTGPLADWAWRFLVAVHNVTQCTPLLYSYGPFLAEHGLEGDSRLSGCPLWLAAYQQDEPVPPAGWGTIAIWQFTDAAQVPGVSGNVDQSRCYVDLASLGKAA